MALLPFRLPDGLEVILETEDPPARPGPRPSSRLEHATQNLVRSFEDALRSVTPMISVLVAHLRTALPQELATIEIQFGLKASGEINGFAVAKAGAEANYNIKLVWNKSG